MKANEEFRGQLKRLITIYEVEVLQARKDGLLTDSTVKTYLVHANNFVKWCNDDFVPGAKNQGKQ